MSELDQEQKPAPEEQESAPEHLRHLKIGSPSSDLVLRATEHAPVIDALIGSDGMYDRPGRSDPVARTAIGKITVKGDSVWNINGPHG